MGTRASGGLELLVLVDPEVGPARLRVLDHVARLAFGRGGAVQLIGAGGKKVDADLKVPTIRW